MSDHALTLWVVGATVALNAFALLHLSITVRQLLAFVRAVTGTPGEPRTEPLRGGLSDLAWRSTEGNKNGSTH